MMQGTSKVGKGMFYWLVFLVVFVILYPKFPLFGVQGTYVSVRIEDLLIAVTMGVWGILNLKRAKELLSKRVTQVFLLFWGIGLLSVISGIYGTFSVVPHLGFLHWLRRIEVMGLFFVGATVIKNSSQVKFILKTLLIVNLIVVLYGFGQVYLQFPVISTTNREFSKGLILSLTPGARPNSTFAGHYDLAMYLSIILIFMGTYFFYNEGKLKSFKVLWQKGFIAGTGLLSFFLLGLTAARVSFVATLGALAMTFWLTGRKLLIVGLIFASLAVVVLSPDLRHRLVATITVNILNGGGEKYNPPPNAVNIFTPDNGVDSASKAAVIQDSIESTKSATFSAKQSTVSADIAAGEPVNATELGVERSFNIRTDVEWPRAIRAFETNPIIGTGYSSLTIATDNDLLRSLGEVGILGTLSFMAIFWLLVKVFILKIKTADKFRKMFLIATLGALASVFATGLFIDVFEASKIGVITWFMLGVGWAVARDYEV